MYDPCDGEFVPFGAVIRVGNNPGPDGVLGPYIHENETHANVGVKSVRVDGNGDLEIKTICPPGAKIMDLRAGADESIVGVGVAAGPSGGLGTVIVKFYRDEGRVRANWSGFTPYANIWFSGIFFIPHTEQLD
jgi:hypothetical protein